MAIFDARISTVLDDTIPLSANIESAENIHGFTEYVIKVTRGYSQNNDGWTVRRRYRDFAQLDSKLTEHAPQLDCPLPPKKVFGNLKREFIAKRTQELQFYLNYILSIPYLALWKDLKTFLDPKNYSQNFAELALQNVTICLRGMQTVSIEKTLPNIGWRLRKTYFISKSLDRSRRERNLVTWIFYGPDFCLDYADAQLVLDFFCKVKHSLIRALLQAVCNERGVALVKEPLESSGTIRDLLCNAKPERNFIQKYVSPREPNCFDVRQLQLLGRRILEVLNFLKDKGIPFCHVHCGNLMVSKDDSVQLVDIENAVLGLPPLYRSFMVQCKAVKAFEDVVVYSFGHTLYELVVGTPLNAAYILPDTMPGDCPAPFVPVLHCILSHEATQNGLPSLDYLLSLDVFVPTWYQTLSSCDNASFRVPSKIKQLLTRCQDGFLLRLHQDQAEYRRAVKTKRVEDYVNSEEQKRLRRRAVREATKEAVEEAQHIGRPNTLDLPSSSSTYLHQQPSSGSLHQPSCSTRLHDQSSTASHQQSPVTSQSTPSLNCEASKSVPPPPPPPPPPNVPVPVSSPDVPSSDRSALLASIRGFSSARLKKTVTADKSGPKF